VAVPARLVEVWAADAGGTGRCGSGWVIGDRGIVTARHVVEPALDQADGTCQVRLATATATDDWIDATVLRSHASLDLTLLKVLDPFPAAVQAVPLLVARLGDQVLDAEAVGFPDATTRPDGMRSPEQPSGRLMPAGGARDDEGRVPFDVSTTVPTTAELWEGMSGAAVRDGRGRVVAVVVSVHPERERRRLYVIPVEEMLGDEAFAAVAAALDWPATLDAAEEEPAAPALRRRRVTLLRWLRELPDQVEGYSRVLWRLGFGKDTPLASGSAERAELGQLVDRDRLALVDRYTRLIQQLPELFATIIAPRAMFDEVYPALRREMEAWFEATRIVEAALSGELTGPLGEVPVSMLFDAQDVLLHERIIRMAAGSLSDLFPIDEVQEAADRG
jgi:hypothetical protein